MKKMSIVCGERVNAGVDVLPKSVDVLPKSVDVLDESVDIMIQH
jgi:hypothetical protein